MYSMFRCNRCEYLRTKYRTREGISPDRSLNGGKQIGKTFRDPPEIGDLEPFLKAPGSSQSQRVNVDLASGMLEELDRAATELNISRQAVIKTLIRQALDQQYLARGSRASGKRR